MLNLIIGCGRVGAGLAKILIERGHSVTVVDMDAQAFERLGENFKGQTVLGVGFDHDVLLKAGIQRADGLAAVTSSDEANVVIARIARDIFHVPKVVARLFDVRQAEIYRRLGLQTISPTSWGINRIADLLLYSQMETISSLGSGEVEIIEVELPPLLVGKMVRDLMVQGEIHVVAVTRENNSFLPTLGTVFSEGDLLHLAVLTTSVDRLKGLLGY
ncbi:MAG: TrkA family potassium uptake protein [Anaerolineales bacterium]|nr:TrkA family potassium uptake protein [Anaerolineales bacterium]